jgi:ubiquinone biosynthesis protein UbiJ
MEVIAMTMVNMKQRYVASTLCPIGKTAQVECAALAVRVFDDDAAASAALVAHLGSAECHTREQLARIVGAVPAYTRSYRLVYENHVWDGLAA